MPRRTTRQKIRGQPDVHANVGNNCRAILRVDDTGIRKKIKKDYEKALRDLENSQRVLDQFQQTDQPRFSRWMNSHFGAVER